MATANSVDPVKVLGIEIYRTEIRPLAEMLVRAIKSGALSFSAKEVPEKSIARDHLVALRDLEVAVNRGVAMLLPPLLLIAEQMVSVGFSARLYAAETRGAPKADPAGSGAGQGRQNAEDIPF